MFNHTFHHIYKFLCIVAQFSYRSNVQNIPYPPYIQILWVPYMPQKHLAASYSMPQNYFLACSFSIHLYLEGSALVSMIGPKQMLLDTQLWEHIASMNLVYDVTSRIVSRIKWKAVVRIYLLHIWLMLHHFAFDNLRSWIISILLNFQSTMGSFAKLSVNRE